MKKKLLAVICAVLVVAAIAGIVILNPKQEPLKTYAFLNPLGTVEPRRETPLADRSRVTDILYGTGTRTLRLGVSWYFKPLDGEPAVAIGQMLKEKWEAESADQSNTKIPAGLTVTLVMGGAFPNGLHPWNNKTDSTYDSWAQNSDAMIIGVGD